MKKEFTEQDLYERMMYVVYCLRTDRNVKSCDSHKHWAERLKESKKHCGDCTSIPMTCSRCMVQSIEVEAQNIIDGLMDDGIGWCKKKCVTECPGAEKGKKLRNEVAQS